VEAVGVDLDPQYKELVELIGQRAHNVFRTGQLWCSEAVLVVVNRGLGGTLPQDLAIRLTSALPQGIGDSGCTCGALSGSALALGLFLGRDRPGAKDRDKVMEAAHLLYAQFKGLFGSTCCRVLTRNVKDMPRAHAQQCANFTSVAAELAATIILQKKAGLVQNADWDYLRKQDSWVSAKVRTIFQR
jgi:C_GCAxxG_C_C family probable redox protein